MADKYGEVNDIARKLAEKFLPGALTLILKIREGLIQASRWGGPTSQSEFRKRIVPSKSRGHSASPLRQQAQISPGQPPARTVGEIVAQLGDVAQYIDPS